MRKAILAALALFILSGCASPGAPSSIVVLQTVQVPVTVVALQTVQVPLTVIVFQTVEVPVTVVVEASPRPTYTPYPTATPYATYTQIPTHTPTPAVSPSPSQVPVPTSTPPTPASVGISSELLGYVTTASRQSQELFKSLGDLTAFLQIPEGDTSAWNAYRVTVLTTQGARVATIRMILETTIWPNELAQVQSLLLQSCDEMVRAIEKAWSGHSAKEWLEKAYARNIEAETLLRQLSAKAD